MVIAYNEAPNIGRCLEKLGWGRQILVVDSGSSDETQAIAARYRQVEVVTRALDDYAGPCNFGLFQVATDWVLPMDCDYILSRGFAAEMMIVLEIVDRRPAGGAPTEQGKRS